MSNALNQSRRANARESNASNGAFGSGANGVSGGGDDSLVDSPFCFDLNVTTEEVRIQFNKPAVVGRVEKKIKLAKTCFKKKAVIAGLITNTAEKEAFSAIFSNRAITGLKDFKGDVVKAHAVSALLCELFELFESAVLYTNDAMSSIDDADLVDQLLALKDGYTTAKDAAEYAKLANISKKMVKLTGATRDRRFLVGGSLPHDEANRQCPCCGHKDTDTVDEPDSNQRVIVANRQKTANHAAQAQRDRDAWNAGLPVYNNSGTVLQQGRSRPQPKMDLITQECHCEQFSCLTNAGDVSKKDCIIKCINPETNARYEVVNGKCLCPICLCDCRKAWSVSCSVVS